jgi:hypothetical protein
VTDARVRVLVRAEHLRRRRTDHREHRALRAVASRATDDRVTERRERVTRQPDHLANAPRGRGAGELGDPGELVGTLADVLVSGSELAQQPCSGGDEDALMRGQLGAAERNDKLDRLADTLMLVERERTGVHRGVQYGGGHLRGPVEVGSGSGAGIRGRRGDLLAMSREKISYRSPESLSDGNLGGIDRDMLAVDPARHLGLVDPDLSGEPVLPAALLVQDALERGHVTHRHATSCINPSCRLSSRVATTTVEGVAKPFPEQLKALAKDHHTSVERVLHDAWDRRKRGTSPAAVKKVLLGERPLRPVQMEQIASVLGEPPEVFGEYRLYLARQLLDEDVHGLDVALANLKRSGLAPATGPVEDGARRRVPGAPGALGRALQEPKPNEQSPGRKDDQDQDQQSNGA